MTTIIINHKVKDYATWKAGFDADAPRREGFGAELLAVGQKTGEAGNVYVVFNVADMNAMQQAMGNAEFQKRLQEAGVLSTDVTVLQ